MRMGMSPKRLKMKTLFFAIGLAAALAFSSAVVAVASPTVGDGYASHAAIAPVMALPSVDQAIGAIAEPETFAIVSSLSPDADPVWPSHILGADHGDASPSPRVLIPK
jgi:hypothetical protein